MPNVSTNYRYLGEGPFDAKQYVNTFADLLKISSGAYNGMLVGVGVGDKRGLYYLNDKSVQDPVWDAPNTRDELNWHKLQTAEDINNLLELYVQTQEFAEVIDAKVEESVTNNSNIVSIYTLESNLNTLVAQIAQDDTATFTNLVESTNNLVAKLVDIDGTVVEAINSAIEAVIVALPVATEEKVGGIKSTTGNNNVTVDTDGVARIETVDVSTLVQPKGTRLVLNGGTANE